MTAAYRPIGPAHGTLVERGGVARPSHPSRRIHQFPAAAVRLMLTAPIPASRWRLPGGLSSTTSTWSRSTRHRLGVTRWQKYPLHVALFNVNAVRLRSASARLDGRSLTTCGTLERRRRSLWPAAHVRRRRTGQRNHHRAPLKCSELFSSDRKMLRAIYLERVSWESARPASHRHLRRGRARACLRARLAGEVPGVA